MAQPVSFWPSWSKTSFSSVPSVLFPHMCLWGWPNLYKIQKEVFENIFSFWYRLFGGERMKSWLSETSSFSWQSLLSYSLKALLTVRSERALAQPRKPYWSRELRHKLNKVTTSMVPSGRWCDVKRQVKGVTSFQCGGSAASVLMSGTSPVETY